MSAAFDPWAALAKIRNEPATPPNPANPPNPVPPVAPGLGALGGLGGGYPSDVNFASAPDAGVGATADAQDDAERAAMAEHYAAEGEAEPYQPSDPDPLRDGLYAGALSYPTAWADPSLVPPRGAWCSCCGRFDRKGGRWWIERQNPTGWACMTCHPPDHLTSEQIQEVTT